MNKLWQQLGSNVDTDYPLLSVKMVKKKYLTLLFQLLTYYSSRPYGMRYVGFIVFIFSKPIYLLLYYILRRTRACLSQVFLSK